VDIINLFYPTIRSRAYNRHAILRRCAVAGLLVRSAMKDDATIVRVRLGEMGGWFQEETKDCGRIGGGTGGMELRL
jgi:hypothetical protein